MSDEARQRRGIRLDSSDPMNKASVVPKPPAAALLENYPRREASFDELRADDGALRPQYAQLFSALEEFGAAELRRRRDAVQRLVSEQGITTFACAG